MQPDSKWVALLDEDPDDFVIIQQGIKNWGPEITLRNFKTFSQFDQTLLAEHPLPALIILNGLSPANMEIDWIKTFRHNDRYAKIPIVILAEDYWEEQKQLYSTVDVQDYQIKPVNQEELKKFIMTIKAILS